MKIAVIGFGEAGQMFGCGLAAKNDVILNAFDIAPTERMHIQAKNAGINFCTPLQETLTNTQFIFSLVTADQARNAAQHASQYLTSGQIFFEMNSVAPKTKIANEKTITCTGATLVDVAIMAPVYPKTMTVPLLVSHVKNDHFTRILCELGLNAKASGPNVGHAAAVKMCRSVMIKGLEALTAESLRAARYYGAEDEVITSLHKSFPHMGWEAELPDYLIGRIAQHGRRRAAEMREVAQTISDAGINSRMALTASKLNDDLVEDMENTDVNFDPEQAFSWRVIADALQKN